MKGYPLLFVLLFLAVPQIFAQDSYPFVIRVDDILSRNTTILPRSITPLEDTVSARGGVITWGVMPHRFLESANNDGVLVNELKASLEQGHEISQHGYIHICQLCNLSSHEMYCTTYNSAFSYNQQLQLVQDGLDLFDEYLDHAPTSFIPPGHIWDGTTIDVLENTGFTTFSDASNDTSLSESVFNLPIVNEYTWALTEQDYNRNLTDALIDIRSSFEEQGYYALMLHDPFIRSGYNNGIVLRWMGELLDSLNTEFGDRIDYMGLTEAADFIRPNSVSVELDTRPFSVPSFALHPNYPNPFNPTTTLSFTIHKPGEAKLTVFDVSGRPIRVLVDDEMASGTYSVTFDGSGLASGAYLYSLRVNGLRQTGRMLLVK